MVNARLESLKVFLKRAPNEFFILAVMAPLPPVILLDPSKWVAVGALIYCGLMGRAYGGLRWLEGYKAGRESKKETVEHDMAHASDGLPDNR